MYSNTEVGVILPTQVNFDQSNWTSFFEQLFEVKRRIIDDDGLAIRLGHAVNVVGRGHRAGAGMFCTTVAGLPGICLFICVAISRPHKSWALPAG